LQTKASLQIGLQGVEELAGCRDMRQLDLSHNGIANLEGVESLPLLQILLLTGNSLFLEKKADTSLLR